MTREERIEKKKVYKGSKYDVPAGDPGVPCKACGQNLHFVKTKSGADMPVEYDGIPHWGFCSEPERFSKGRGKR